MTVPQILGPDGHDFHDSSLIDFRINRSMNEVSIVLSTPDETDNQELWQITLSGVLRLEYETVGDGSPTVSEELDIPLEVYDVSNDTESEEYSRWKKRLEDLEIKTDTSSLYHIILSSSFLRGWGKNESLEGISIVCRKVTVEQAPLDYKKKRGHCESASLSR